MPVGYYRGKKKRLNISKMTLHLPSLCPIFVLRHLVTLWSFACSLLFLVVLQTTFILFPVWNLYAFQQSWNAMMVKSIDLETPFANAFWFEFGPSIRVSFNCYVCLFNLGILDGGGRECDHAFIIPQLQMTKKGVVVMSQCSFCFLCTAGLRAELALWHHNTPVSSPFARISGFSRRLWQSFGSLFKLQRF